MKGMLLHIAKSIYSVRVSGYIENFKNESFSQKFRVLT